MLTNIIDHKMSYIIGEQGGERFDISVSTFCPSEIYTGELSFRLRGDPLKIWNEENRKR